MKFLFIRVYSTVILYKVDGPYGTQIWVTGAEGLTKLRASEVLIILNVVYSIENRVSLTFLYLVSFVLLCGKTLMRWKELNTRLVNLESQHHSGPSTFWKHSLKTFKKFMRFRFIITIHSTEETRFSRNSEASASEFPGNL